MLGRGVLVGVEVGAFLRGVRGSCVRSLLAAHVLLILVESAWSSGLVLRAAVDLLDLG